jgi:PIN domain nuclease of toxin-antitoxin system
VNRLNLLLDTHILLWWLDANKRLSGAARHAITEAEFVYVSAVSAWEIGIKTALGKLEFAHDLGEQIAINSFRPLAVTVAHATAAGGLPLHHKDLFGRMLIAQAMCESLTLLTVDARIRTYNVPMMLA